MGKNADAALAVRRKLRQADFAPTRSLWDAFQAIDCAIGKDEVVLPMIPGGGGLEDIIMT